MVEEEILANLLSVVRHEIECDHGVYCALQLKELKLLYAFLLFLEEKLTRKQESRKFSSFIVTSCPMK